MTSTEQNPDLRVQVIAAWLGKRGFVEAATHLLKASDEVVHTISDAEHLAWLNYQDELEEAHRTSGNDDDLPWE